MTIEPLITDGQSTQLVDLFRQRLALLGLSQDDAQRVITAGGSLQDGMERIIRDLATPASALLPGHYRVRVATGNPLFLPPFGELNGGSRFDNASTLFNGSYVWKLHKSIEVVDTTPGPRDFLLKDFGTKIKSEAVIDWAGNNGYQVTTPAERFAFAEAHPDLQRQFPIVDLGSSTVGDGRAYVAVLLGFDGRRILDGDWFGPVWPSVYRFLLRKQLGH